jgi:Skp family chaperone for outer membrane proteins
MKLALLASLLLLSAAARAETIAVFDLQKVLATSAEGVKNATDEKADLAAKQAEVTHAMEAVKTSKLADKPAAQARVDELTQRYQQEIAQRQQSDAAKLVARVQRILPAVAKAKHLGAVVPTGGAFYAVGAMDLTGEVVRRLDAGDGKEAAPAPTAEEVAALKGKIAQLEAEKAALAKPQPASPPATVAAKGKK